MDSSEYWIKSSALDRKWGKVQAQRRETIKALACIDLFYSSHCAGFLNHVFKPMSRRSEKKAPAVRSSAPASPVGEMPGVADSRLPESESRPAGLNGRWTVIGVCIFLAAVIWVVFGQTLRYDFVNYDDNPYVHENPVVQKGLTWEGFRWALTYGNIGHWHPLTWVSHMLDCQFYGLNPGGHHLTNILLHTAAAILLFLVLRRMTGALWRSAFVAAVFAIHPLHVESVAWVAERKDVLSGVFFMLTIGAYVRYVRRPPSVIRYGTVVLFFALGLLSKNMLVTLPFVLLLLDYWPLNRFSGFSPQVLLRRVAEKIPLFVLTVASCVATALVPEKLTAERLPFGLRMENAVVSYVTYLWQMIHPSGLACLYPNPANYLPFWQVAGALGLLLAISGAVWAFRKTHPYLVVGWLWYLGMMIPVIGIVQISYYAHADRYTYLPQIGLYLLVTWAVADLCAGWRHRRVVLGGCATVILVALIFCARVQTSYWRNSESLWTYTLACTSDNFIGHYALGNALFQKGSVDEAIVHYQKALQINPDFAGAHNNLGSALLKKGSVDEAIAHYQRALQITPGYAEAHNSLGNALLQKGEVDEAIAQYQKALQITPDSAEAHNNLGNALFQKGSVDEAIAHYQKALQINSDFVGAHNNLGNALLQKGRVDEAITHFQKALQINPDNVEAHNSLGNALLKKGNVDEAIVHYQKALQINPDSMEAHYNLGNAFRQKGRIDKAIVHYQKALQINPDYAEAHNNLGSAFLQMGRMDEAIIQYQTALRIKPDYAEAHNNLGNAFRQMGRMDEAIVHYQKALQIKPDYPGALNNLARVLATCPQASLRNGNKAVELAQRANQLTGDGNPVVLGTLAAAYAEAGRFPEAVKTAQRALQLAERQSNTALADAIRSQLKLYQAGIPFHQESQ
jgi:tetratricopeptide (TPR) repeat protein